MGARRSWLEEGLAEEVGVSASTKLIEVTTEVPAREPALPQRSSYSLWLSQATLYVIHGDLRPGNVGINLPIRVTLLGVGTAGAGGAGRGG